MRYLYIVALLLLFSCAKQPYPYMAEEIDSVEDINSVEYLEPEREVDISWTNWNKAMFGFAIAGQTMDIHSTKDMLSRGCVEMNPILGEHPSDLSLVLLKVAGIGTMYIMTEYLAPKEVRQVARNLTYGILGAAGVALGIHNYSLDCP